MDAYGYCYQNPINLVDPTGMSAEPPTDYVDEKGKLLLRTNDGSNTVITVTKDKEEEFRNSVDSSDFGLDTKSWNFTMKKFLVGEWSQTRENIQSWYSTPEARGSVSRFWQTGDMIIERAYANNEHIGEFRIDVLAW